MNSKDNKQKKKKSKLFNNFCYDFVRITGALPMLLWLRPKIYRPYGRVSLKGGVMLSANHRSLLDPVIVHTAFPSARMNCLATKDLFNTKTKKVFFNLMNCICVDKENFTLSAFHEVVSRLEDGKTVVIFPEGRLYSDSEDTIHAFKSGAVLMAYKGKKPILPIYIVKREKWYHRQKIVIGKPFDVAEAVGKMPTMDQLNAATETLRKMEFSLREYYESISKKRKKDKSPETKENITEEIKDEQTL